MILNFRQKTKKLWLFYHFPRFLTIEDNVLNCNLTCYKKNTQNGFDLTINKEFMGFFYYFSGFETFEDSVFNCTLTSYRKTQNDFEF